MLDGLAGKLDRLIGVFSPERAASRRYFREVMAMADKKRIEQYASAKTSRLTGTWSPANSNVNDIIGASSYTVRSRVRQLVRDFPYFSRAVNAIVDWTVGDGIIYQAMISRPSGELATKTNQKIEDAFKWWGDEADIAGKLHFYEIMQLAKRQDVESGEFLIVKTRSNRSGRFIPYCLQVYEADWLSSNTIRNVAKGNEVDQGIEYNTNTGRVIAYHLTDPDSWGKTRRILAENVIHGFKTLRPGQLRGISSLAPGVLVAHSLHEYMDTEIDAAKMAAKYLSFVKTPNPLARQMGAVTTDPETGQKLEEIENGIIEYLRPGEEIEIAANPRPGTNFPPFVKLILCMLAVTAEVPYELISGNYEGLNYSVSRSIRNDFAQQLRPVARRHVRHFGMPILSEFLNEAVMAGKLSLPGYWNDSRAYLKCEWQPPGMEPVDPSRETKSQIDSVNNLLRSPQEIARARGRNLEDIYKEIKDAKSMAKNYGIEVTAKTSTALANNPAALEKQKTGQIMEDEKFFRTISDLPDILKQVEDAWSDDGGVRRPITLKYGTEVEGLAGDAVGEVEE